MVPSCSWCRGDPRHLKPTWPRRVLGAELTSTFEYKYEYERAKMIERGIQHQGLPPRLRLPASEPGRVAIVGAGPNGLTAAALLARAGWDVEVIEQAPEIGGACSSSQILGEGTIVDLGAAAHPFATVSPAFRELRLERHGLRWLHPPVVMGHPLPDGEAGLLIRDVGATVADLGQDGSVWRRWHAPVTEYPYEVATNALGPLIRRWPHPLAMVNFGLRAPWPARAVGDLAFKTEKARALFAGSAAHALMAPSRLLTASFGTLFGGLGMSTGWPVAEGGSGAITRALSRIIEERGGRIRRDYRVRDLREFKNLDAVILDMIPKDIIALSGINIPATFIKSSLRRRPGPAVYKLDILLDGPVPWVDRRLCTAGTVHVCGTAADVQIAEAAVAAGTMPERPFVMVCQQQAADPTRAAGPASGRTVLWTYAHVPNGFENDARGHILAQIERFAPGFRDRIVTSVATPPKKLENWNPNLLGGDIAAGAMSPFRLIGRPGSSASTYRIVEPRAGHPGLYIASAAVAPGAGVHGMGGAWAARAVLHDKQLGA